MDKSIKCEQNKVTKNVVRYPQGYEPDYIVPSEYEAYRYIIGKRGNNPLVAICMNPSAARDTDSDRTINRIIKISQNLGYDGWFVFNLYPERATDARLLDEFDKSVSDINLQVIRDFLVDNGIKEVWGAWGNNNGIQTLVKGKEELIIMLRELGIKVFYYGTLTKAGNPRHPLQRQEKWDFADKRYLFY